MNDEGPYEEHLHATTAIELSGEDIGSRVVLHPGGDALFGGVLKQVHHHKGFSDNTPVMTSVSVEDGGWSLTKPVPSSCRVEVYRRVPARFAAAGVSPKEPTP
jgi:hypothetical protein